MLLKKFFRRFEHEKGNKIVDLLIYIQTYPRAASQTCFLVGRRVAVLKKNFVPSSFGFFSLAPVRVSLCCMREQQLCTVRRAQALLGKARTRAALTSNL